VTEEGSQESYEQRAELASIAGALHAYLEYHMDAGTVGFPRQPWERPSEQAMPVVASAFSSEPEPEATASAQSTPAAAQPQARAAQPPPPPASPPPLDPAARLAQLAVEVSSCRKCGLCHKRKRTAFARGSVGAQVMFVGEAPGLEDDAQGKPFVGRAGALLDKMIAAMQLDSAYICNVMKCRPPDNRRPEPSEIDRCLPYLHEQIAMVRPAVIVVLGSVAAGAVLDTADGVEQLRGGWRLYRGHTMVMTTYHPSRLLRADDEQPEVRKKVWEDLQMVMTELARRKAAQR